MVQEIKKLWEAKKEKGGDRQRRPLFIGQATGAANHRSGDHCLGEETS